MSHEDKGESGIFPALLNHFFLIVPASSESLEFSQTPCSSPGEIRRLSYLDRGTHNVVQAEVKTLFDFSWVGVYRTSSHC